MKSIYKKVIAATALVFTMGSVSLAQVKIGDNPALINAGSVLELESTNKGLLMPRVSLANTTTWGLAGTPTAGMHVYNTNASIASTNNAYPTAGNKVGEYYWDGTGWLALVVSSQRSTAITTSSQTSGISFVIPANGLPRCAAINCSVDMNINSSFTVSNPSNDVLLNLVGDYAFAGQNSNVAFFYRVAVDINTPGVYELVNQFYVQTSDLGCTGSAINFLTSLKNLPPRTYNVKVYASPWINGSSNAVTVAMGVDAAPICGTSSPPFQKMITSVSQ